jgi:tetratricopeptide (TPR) repeat protein
MTFEPSLKDGDEPRIECVVRAQFGREVSRKFSDAVAKHANVIVSKQAQLQTKKDVPRWHASTAFDALVFYLGIIEYANGRFDHAEIFFDKLNARVLRRSDLHADTRANLIWLHAVTLIASSSFPGHLPPHGEELLEVIRKCEKAVTLYGANLPSSYASLARDYFYLKDIEKAFQANETGIANGLKGFELTTAILNRAVLQLLRGKIEESATDFRLLFISPVL